jgi:pimeloyl-ACP methyl ester carboxylesterase
MSSPLHYVLDGIHCEPHFFTVPLDHQHPDEEATLTLFAPSAARTSWMMTCPGCSICRGPGLWRSSPDRRWRLDQAGLQEFRVLLLDQRGTGHSTPISADALARMTPVSRRTTSAIFAPTA